MAAATTSKLVDWLDDLSVRFLLNLPASELSSVPRLCFQVEEAQWFYEDFIRPAAAAAGEPLPSLPLRQFCLLLFQHCPLLSGFSDSQHIAAYEEFLAYKVRVPVRGAILMDANMEKLILVKGWKKGASWSFPRGKINKDEKDLDCAVREVYEETGYDVRRAGLISENEADVKHIDITMREQHMRLFVFRGVPDNTYFEPKTRKEISKIQWYNVRDLPGFKKQNKAADQTAHANKFYMVAPFLGPLKKWINQQRKKDAAEALHSHAHAFTEDEGLLTEDYITQTSAQPRSDDLMRLFGRPAEPPLQHVQAAQQITPQSQPDLLALLQGGSRVPQTPIDQIQSAPQPISPQPHHARHPSQGYHGPIPPFQFSPARVPTVPQLSPSNNNMFNARPYPMTQNHALVQQTMQHGLQQHFGGPQQWARQPPQELMAQGGQGAISGGPNVPSAERLPMPNLNTHSMNLLNAFKAGAKPATSGNQADHKPRQSSIHQTALLDLFKKPVIHEKPVELPQPTEEPPSPTRSDVTMRPAKIERKATLNEITRTLPKMKVKSPLNAAPPELPANVPSAPKAMQQQQQQQRQGNKLPAEHEKPYQLSRAEWPTLSGSTLSGPTAPKTILQRSNPPEVSAASKPSAPRPQSQDELQKPSAIRGESGQSGPQFTILSRPASSKASPSKSSEATFQPQVLKRKDAEVSPPAPQADANADKRDKLLALFGQSSATAVPKAPVPQADETGPASRQANLLGLFNSTKAQEHAPPQLPPAPAIQPERQPSYQGVRQKASNAPLLDLFTRPTPTSNNVVSPSDAISPFALGTPATKAMPQSVFPPIGSQRPSISSASDRPSGERSRLNSVASGVSGFGSGQATPTETKGFLLDYLNGVVQKEGNRSRR